MSSKADSLSTRLVITESEIRMMEQLFQTVLRGGVASTVARSKEFASVAKKIRDARVKFDASIARNETVSPLVGGGGQAPNSDEVKIEGEGVRLPSSLGTHVE
jgi:hypothetical protein